MYKDEEKRTEQILNAEQMSGGFECIGCGEWVSFSRNIGTAHRNHCPFCFCSKHVDLNKSGDRRSSCRAKMVPVGLTFKNEGLDKYGKKRQGELMFIHECALCGKKSINKIAGDDDEKKILELFEKSLGIDQKKIDELAAQKIEILSEKDRGAIKKQLFGKDSAPIAPN